MVRKVKGLRRGVHREVWNGSERTHENGKEDRMGLYLEGDNIYEEKLKCVNKL